MNHRGLMLALVLGLVLSLALPTAAQQSVDLTIYLYRDGQAAPVAREGTLRGDPQADAVTLLTSLLAGPTSEEQASGYTSAFPPDAQLVAVTVSGVEVTVDLRLPLDYLREGLTPPRSDAIVEQIVKTLHPLDLYHVQVRAEDESGQFVSVSDFLPRPRVPVPAVPQNKEPLPERLGPEPKYVGQPPITGQGQPRGALSGKTVWLSAGHGWYWSDTLSRWTTQRGNNHGLVEDFSNAEAVNYYLARYLWNAGANVWLVRDRSMTEREVIVDNDDGAPAYTETGSWLTSQSPGYGGGSYRWSTTFDQRSATATWTPDLPEAGWYTLWTWYRHGTNRPTDARYEIHHAGGVTMVSISQEVHGLAWLYLGEYYFAAGMAGHVTLVNESNDPGQAIVADAVRFGGGLGSVAEPSDLGPNGGTSVRPRWEEAAKYWARYQGAPPEVSAYDSTSRPLYAEWETAKGYPGEADNTVYISWHTNAGGASGTESYIHSTEPTPGSAELQDQVHAELIHDLRAAWDPQWVNRGQKRADFGEVRELSTIPGLLLEIAFHDSEDPGDADDLREPVFRQVAARAVFQGIVKYFAERDGVPLHVLPEPPTRLMGRNNGPGQVTLSWAAPPCCDGLGGDAATSYKVYQSVDGRAFDNGIETVNITLTLTGLPPSTLLFYRVTALNEGGESFPSPVVAVRTPAVGKSPSFLIVDGFDRLDQTAMVPQWEAPFLGTDQRMFLDRMNRYDYAVEHGTALSACDLAFDGAVNEAVEAGDVSLQGYAAVDWFVGEDSVADAALSDAERTSLAAYLDAGGRLLISGAEIGYDLVAQGRDPAFYRSYLHAEHLGDDANTSGFAGVTGGPFAGLAGTFDGGNGSTYEVGRPDRLAAVSGATEVLRYAGGTGDGAAVAYDGDFRVVHFGFPLETVTEPATRTALICTAADYLLPDGEPPEMICAPRLINPGFEGTKSQTAWQVNSSEGDPVLSHRDDLPPNVAPHKGDWVAWLGGYTPGIATTTLLAQVVALPPGEPMVSLKLAWFVRTDAALVSSADAAPNADSLSIVVYDMAGTPQATFPLASDSSLGDVWQETELDLSAFAGETIQLTLRAESNATAFFVDNVRLTTCGPRGADEFRALWVDAYHDGIKSKRQIDELIETARAGNFNALVVQVRRRGDTYYPSAIDPWAADATPGFDALAYLIEKAHDASIEVHAWAATLAIWSGDSAPAVPQHTFNLHGSDADGSDRWLMYSHAGLDRPPDGVYYIDPGHPDVADYTVAIYAELATRYDLDGLHLDRIRYPGESWGYNPISVARFQAATGREDHPDPLDSQWLQWRRDQVTALVRKIYLTVAAIDPQLRLSAALSAAGSPPIDVDTWQTGRPYAQHLQDWRGWLEEGILDLGLPMIYRNEDTHAGQFDGWIEWAKDHQYSRGVVLGTGLYHNTVENSMSQWKRIRQPSGLGNQGLGICGYSYATPSNSATTQRGFVNAVVTDLFTQPASVPGIPWRDSPVLGHVMGTLVTKLPCLASTDGQVLKLSGSQSRRLLTDGSGWFGAVGLPPGDYRLTLENPVCDESINVPLTVIAGAVTELQVVVPGSSPSEYLYLPLVANGRSR